MYTFDEYAAHMAGLAHPTWLPEHMPVMYAAMLGRPIISAFVDNHGDGELVIRFGGGGTLKVWDNGRSCCESRYMTTDDDLPSFIGAKVVSLEAVDGPDVEEVPDEDGCTYGEVHEQTFVKLETTMGTITLVTHNEHNGYYGGFDIACKWED